MESYNVLPVLFDLKNVSKIASIWIYGDLLDNWDKQILHVETLQCPLR